MSEMKSRMNVEQVHDALYFLSNIGEILYYGNSTDEILSRFVILSRKWLVSALYCILRPDLQRELDETRRFYELAVRLLWRIILLRVMSFRHYCRELIQAAPS